MQTIRAERIVESLQTVGVRIELTDDGGLRVKPASRLTAELREAIRDTKAELLRYFSVFAANDPVSPPEPPADPNAWRELAAAYHAHHFTCQHCIAAGRGERYGSRCHMGLALWNDYSKADTSPFSNERKPITQSTEGTP